MNKIPKRPQHGLQKGTAIQRKRGPKSNKNRNRQTQFFNTFPIPNRPPKPPTMEPEKRTKNKELIKEEKQRGEEEEAEAIPTSRIKTKNIQN